MNGTKLHDAILRNANFNFADFRAEDDTDDLIAALRARGALNLRQTQADKEKELQERLQTVADAEGLYQNILLLQKSLEETEEQINAHPNSPLAEILRKRVPKMQKLIEAGLNRYRALTGQ